MAGRITQQREGGKKGPLRDGEEHLEALSQGRKSERKNNEKRNIGRKDKK